MRNLTDKELEQASGGLGKSAGAATLSQAPSKSYDYQQDLKFPAPRRDYLRQRTGQCRLQPFTYKSPYIKNR